MITSRREARVREAAQALKEDQIHAEIAREQHATRRVKALARYDKLLADHQRKCARLQKRFKRETAKWKQRKAVWEKARGEANVAIDERRRRYRHP